MTERVIRIISSEALNNYVATVNNQEPGTTPKYKLLRLKAKITFGTSIIPTNVSVVEEVETRTYYFTQDQINSLSELPDLSCDYLPNLGRFVRANSTSVTVLPFTEEKKRPLLVPISKSAAAGVILAFYNERRDPIERIASLFPSDSGDAVDEINRILTTYYLCCLKYITDDDFKPVIAAGAGQNLIAMIDDHTCIPSGCRAKYNNLKKDVRDIPQSIVAFHAVYGAYVLCRPVASKKEFRTWLMKRYNAFLASIQQTDSVVNLDLQTGGTRVNNLVITRSVVRKIVFNIIKNSYVDICTAAVKNHIKMLTALAEMTTYSLVNKVIAMGGCSILVNPLPKQIVAFMQERLEVITEIEAAGYSASDVIYIHLFMPEKQCFTASNYADLIVVAGIIEEIHGGNKTLDRFKAKTENTTVNVKQIRTFLAAQSMNVSIGIDDHTKEELRRFLGDSVDELVTEATRIVKLMAKQNNIIN